MHRDRVLSRSVQQRQANGSKERNQEDLKPALPSNDDQFVTNTENSLLISEKKRKGYIGETFEEQQALKAEAE